MFVLLCALVVCTILGFVMLIHAAFTAPYGEETAHGFHVTSPVELNPAQAPATLLNPADLAFFQP